jgi:polar amino acid transport system substrate-binding protein
MSNHGKYDGDVCRIDGTEKKYKNLIKIKYKATKLFGAILVNKNYFKTKVTSLKELDNTDIGIRIGHLYAEKAVKDYNPKNITRLTTDEQLLEMLNLSRIKAGIIILHNALSLIKKSPDSYKNIAIANPYFVVTNVYFYIHKKHKNLVEKLNKAAQNASKAGFVDDELAKYIAPYNQVLKEFKLP